MKGRYVAMLRKGESTWEEFREEAEWVDGDIRETALEVGHYTGSRPGRSPGPPVEAELNELERAYAATYGRYLELRGEKWPFVTEFRNRVLGGRLLSSDEANALVWSQLAAFVSPERLESEGVPIVGHNAQLLKNEIRREDNRYHEHVVFHVDPPGRTLDVSKRGGGPGERRSNALKYRVDGGHVETFFVERGSVLYQLYEASVTLSHRLFADEAGATRFVLTGEWPQAPPLEAEIRVGSIALTASSWISGKTLRRFYLQLQQRLRGGENRPIKEKARAALLFVAEHTDEHEDRPSWETLRKLWNERHPEWRYKNREDLYEAYRRAKEVLIPGPPDLF